MRATHENLRKYAVAPLAQWLIDVAIRRSSLTYGEAKRRLEIEIGFGTIFSTEVGFPAGVLMDQMLQIRPDVPLLNCLLVQQGDSMPGKGAGLYMAKYLNNPALALPRFRDRNLDQWRVAFDKVATDVYSFRDWDQVYQETFGQLLPAPAIHQGTERDGFDNTRKGEGQNHKALRLWIKDNPEWIHQRYIDFKTDTEFVLDSGDRVDVVYRGPASTVVIEVKSLDSNDADLRRGVYQCIKYRAVMEAMDVRSDAHVVPILVTQRKIPNDLNELVRRHDIRHLIAPEKLR